MPEIIGVRVLGQGGDGGIAVLRKRGLMMDVPLCKSWFRRLGGGQSEVFTVSRRIDPIGQGGPSSLV